MSTFYDPLNHAYYIDGQQVISVTQVLKLAGRIDMTWYTDEARERGTAVHGYAEQMDRNPTRRALIAASLSEAIGGPIDAYLGFLRDHQPRWTHIEAGRFHLVERYGGRTDRIGIVHGDPAVVELKTGAEEDWHGLQLAGYQGLIPTGARYVLYLKPNGRYKFVRCRRAQDYPDFHRDLVNTREIFAQGAA